MRTPQRQKLDIAETFTHYLGWRHHCDVVIVMGLACYGDAMAKVPGDTRSYYEIFEEIVQEIDEYNYCIHLDWIDYHRVRDKWVSDNFCSVFGEIGHLRCHSISSYLCVRVTASSLPTGLARPG